MSRKPLQFPLQSLFWLTAAVGLAIVALPWSWVWDSALPLVVATIVPALIVLSVAVGEKVKHWHDSAGRDKSEKS